MKFDFFNLKTSVTFYIAECQLLVTNTKKFFFKKNFFCVNDPKPARSDIKSYRGFKV